MQNLFAGAAGTLPKERFDELIRGGRFRLERIVSTGHVTPEGQWYDQDDGMNCGSLCPCLPSAALVTMFGGRVLGLAASRGLAASPESQIVVSMADPLPPNPTVNVTRLDRWTGPCLFWVSFAFLAILAGMLCSFSIEVAQLARVFPEASRGGHDARVPPSSHLPASTKSLASADAKDQEDEVPPEHAIRPLRRFGWCLGLFYLAIVGEIVAHALTGGKGWRRHLWYCLAPPLRMGGRDHVDGGSIWLLHLGWRRVDRSLQKQLERAFNGPMILIALAVLPLFALDWHWQNRAVTPSWRMLVFLWASESLIWLAFAFEFVIMISVSPKKLRYCRDHWIDLVIILAPMVGFLRLVRVARVLRLSQVSRAARVYRLRGLGQRMFRGLLVLSLVRNLLEGDPAKRLAKLQEELRDRELDLEQLRAEIAEVEQRLAAKKQKMDEASGDGSCNSAPARPP